MLIVSHFGKAQQENHIFAVSRLYNFPLIVKIGAKADLALQMQWHGAMSNRRSALHVDFEAVAAKVDADPLRMRLSLRSTRPHELHQSVAIDDL